MRYSVPGADHWDSSNWWLDRLAIISLLALSRRRFDIKSNNDHIDFQDLSNPAEGALHVSTAAIVDQCADDVAKVSRSCKSEAMNLVVPGQQRLIHSHLESLFILSASSPFRFIHRSNSSLLSFSNFADFCSAMFNCKPSATISS